MLNIVYLKMLMHYFWHFLPTQFSQWWNIITRDQTFRGQMCLDLEAFKYCPYFFLLLFKCLDLLKLCLFTKTKRSIQAVI